MYRTGNIELPNRRGTNNGAGEAHVPSSKARDGPRLPVWDLQALLGVFCLLELDRAYAVGVRVE